MEKNGQLEMNFSVSGNRLKQQLEDGIFSLWIEHAAPGKDTSPEAASARLAALEEAVLDVSSFPCGLAITDRYGFTESWRTAEYLSALSPENRDRHLVYLSGKDTSPEVMRELIGMCGAARALNVIPVTGDRFVGEDERATRLREFTESITTLRMIQKENNTIPFYPGCVVNPFKYRSDALLTQFFKMVKKLNVGANFIVAQAGWNMEKLQALKWFLSYRNLEYPVIARLIFLTPERAERIINGEFPGVEMSRDFCAILRKELSVSAQQFEAAQLQRLALQAAGCRLMGFSGIQLAGMDTPERGRIASRRILEALHGYKNFDFWVNEYRAYLARAEMAPYPHSFNFFEDLLSRAYLDDDPKLEKAQLPVPGLFSRCNRSIRKFLFPCADKQAAGDRYWLKKIFAGCHHCNQCRLPQTFFVCPERCPKHLSNGPCGGCTIEGMCECGNFPCVFHEIYAFAGREQCLDALEERLVVPPSGGIL